MALGLHGVFLGQVGSLTSGAPPDAKTGPMSVRTIEAEPAQEPAGAVPEPVAEPVAVAPPPPAPKPRVVRRPREPAQAVAKHNAPPEEAGTGSEASASASAAEAAASATEVSTPAEAPPVEVAQTPVEAPASAPIAASAEPASAAASAAAPSLLAAGEQPPPTYRTKLPPSATLRYQVRRGFLRGTGEIRWRLDDAAYRLVLEARIAGLTLLIQTSEGGIDATGLAPVRFLDQRARRPAQAANFRRDAGTITFSGPGVEWPLLAGSQDRLSWMIQLAGIAAAEPELLVEGGRITMVVVGARGEASVWTLRYVGRENVETARGTVNAVKLVRDGRSAYDTSAEIWLDPERDYFPAHATLRNSSGASEYDLLLERVDPPS